MNKNKLYLVFIIGSLLVVLITALLFIIPNYYSVKKLKQNIQTVSSPSGVPLFGTKEYTKDGWDKITDVGGLSKLASDEGGGEMVEVKTVTYNNLTYAKVKVASDNGDAYYYYYFEDGWGRPKENQIPTTVTDALNAQ